MKIPPATATESVTVLSASPIRADHLSLRAIISHSKWTILLADNLSAARNALRQHPEIAVVVCESDLVPGSWTDILEDTQAMPHPPSLIVTSRLADERLWSEVLNLGGWDVLAKPFDQAEVLRVVKLAWDHWYHQSQMAERKLNVLLRAG